MVQQHRKQKVRPKPGMQCRKGVPTWACGTAVEQPMRYVMDRWGRLEHPCRHAMQWWSTHEGLQYVGGYKHSHGCTMQSAWGSVSWCSPMKCTAPAGKLDNPVPIITFFCYLNEGKVKEFDTKTTDKRWMCTGSSLEMVFFLITGRVLDSHKG